MASDQPDSPDTLKFLALLFLCLIFLPTLAIAAIPNILFGYESAKATDIVAIKDQADYITTYYQQINIAIENCIAQIVVVVEADYESRDGSPSYDDVSVTRDIGNTNLYWFIAISAVDHDQDLFSMSADSITSLVGKMLTYSAELVETESGKTILSITVTDLAPDPLMEKLGFSEQKKNWANVLYSSMIDSQYVDTSEIGAGLELEDMTFTDAQTEVVYYSQLDVRWCNTMYGKSGTIGEAGCGPTALAMVVASFADSSVTPVEVAQWAVKNGHRCEGNGSYHSIIPEGAKHYGLSVEGIGLDTGKLVQALEEGKLIIAIMGPGHFTKGGHFIVLRGITADGKILVADSASVSRSQQTWDLSIFPVEAVRNAGSGGPFWVVN